MEVVITRMGATLVKTCPAQEEVIQTLKGADRVPVKVHQGKDKIQEEILGHMTKEVLEMEMERATLMVTGIKEVRPKVRIQVQADLQVKVRVGVPEIRATVNTVDIKERVDTVAVEMEEIMVETTETTEVEGMEVMEGREVTTRPR